MMIPPNSYLMPAANRPRQRSHRSQTEARFQGAGKQSLRLVSGYFSRHAYLVSFATKHRQT